MINLLIITDGWFHPSIIARFWLSYVITGPGYRYKHIRNINNLIGMNLSPFNAMVLFFHHESITNEAFEIFDQFVSEGGGVLAIHSVTASFKEEEKFTKIIGGKFVQHGPIAPIEVRPMENSEIFSEIRPFRIEDELYIHDLQPDIQEHCYTVRDEKNIPVVWTRNHGNGRICYVSPGHKAKTFRNKEIQRILMKGLEWICACEKLS